MRLTAKLFRTVLAASDQRLTFTRQWLLYDARQQNPFESAEMIAKVLQGRNKPMFHPKLDSGDHVVVINCKEIAMPWYEWKFRMYYHHTDYAGGASWTSAWELHDSNPTKVIEKAVYHAIPGDLMRHLRMARLHMFADDKIPNDIRENLTYQLRQLRPVARKLEDIPEEERQQFPKLFDYPKDFLL